MGPALGPGSRPSGLGGAHDTRRARMNGARAEWPKGSPTREAGVCGAVGARPRVASSGGCEERGGRAAGASRPCDASRGGGARPAAPRRRGKGGHALHNRQLPHSGRRGPPRPREDGLWRPGGGPVSAPPQTGRARGAAGHRGPVPPLPHSAAGRGSLTFRAAPDHHARARPPPPASRAPAPLPQPRSALAGGRGGGPGKESHRRAAPPSTLTPRSPRPALRALRGGSRASTGGRARRSSAQPSPSPSAAGALPAPTPPSPPGSPQLPRGAQRPG